MKLPSLTVDFEFLTPAWIGGAMPAESAEVRVSTIRGHLRQWLRVLYPGQALDEEIFGRIANDERDAPSASSKVLLQLDKQVIGAAPKNLVAYIGARDERDAMQHSEAYFLWPLRTQSRGVLLPGVSSQFTLNIRWYPVPANRGEELIAQFNDSLRAFGILGCIGTRATRGYGSVWRVGQSFANDGELRDELRFLPDSVSVRLLPREFRDGRTALAAAAQWMRSFRVGSQTYGRTTPQAVSDHDAADPAQHAQHDAKVYRHALGMPLAQRFNRGRDNTSTVESRYRHDGFETDRYPSPMRIKVIRMGGCFRVLIILLRNLLLPDGTRITLSSRRPYESRQAVLSNDLLNEMINSGIGIH